MASYIFFGTIHKILKQEIVVQRLVKPVAVYYSAPYSNDIKNKTPVADKISPKEYLASGPNPNGDSKKKRSWKILVLPIMSLITATCLGISIVLILGAPEIDADGKIVRDDLSYETPIKQYIIRAGRELKYYIELIEQPKKEKLLPDPLDAPYNQPKYTLVIELTDVMVHPEWTYSAGWRYKKRPLLNHFLEALKDSYEIILYTAESGRTVFAILDEIDPDNVIAYKLVKGTTHFMGFTHRKELNKLNRDLKKVICVDWNAENVKSNQDNLLKIKRWTGKEDDTSLLDLTAFLKTITDSQIDDVREVLKYYSKYNDPVEAFRKKQEMLIEELEEAAAKREEPQNAPKKFKLFT